jgi:hypothetical protein
MGAVYPRHSILSSVRTNDSLPGLRSYQGTLKLIEQFIQSLLPLPIALVIGFGGHLALRLLDIVK